MRIHAETALLPDGWARDVVVTIAEGRIVSAVSGDLRDAGRHADERETGDLRVGCLLPAMANLHSHTFQRAMAGLTERRGNPADSFWTWRALMYRFLDRLTPADVEAIAAQVMVEMAEAGYAAVAEFHYLHHRPDGAPYDDLAEMAGRIVAAAQQTGLGLTLLPVLYQRGGLDGRALGAGQMRFGNDETRFAGLWDGAKRALSALPADAVLGVAPHSLRAVASEGLRFAASLGGPIHIHVAEQQAEVDEVLAHTGARPVEWLLDNMPVDSRWCAIHATQMLPDETLALARSGAVAGLCPITEANLGDGIFDGARFLAAGGVFGVGSDSNVRISLSEELRFLEYSQRLRDRGRAVLATPDKSTGRVLFEGAAQGGAQAAGRTSGRIEAGCWADLVTLDTRHLHLQGLAGDDLLDAFVFAGDDRLVTDVWSAGRHIVQGGRHIGRDAVETRFRTVMAKLRDRL